MLLEGRCACGCWRWTVPGTDLTRCPDCGAALSITNSCTQNCGVQPTRVTPHGIPVRADQYAIAVARRAAQSRGAKTTNARRRAGG